MIALVIAGSWVQRVLQGSAALAQVPQVVRSAGVQQMHSSKVVVQQSGLPQLLAAERQHMESVSGHRFVEQLERFPSPR